jgi:hypothetical protein
MLQLMMVLRGQEAFRSLNVSGSQLQRLDEVWQMLRKYEAETTRGGQLFLDWALTNLPLE